MKTVYLSCARALRRALGAGYVCGNHLWRNADRGALGEAVYGLFADGNIDPGGSIPVEQPQHFIAI